MVRRARRPPGGAVAHGVARRRARAPRRTRARSAATGRGRRGARRRRHRGRCPAGPGRPRSAGPAARAALFAAWTRAGRRGSASSTAWNRSHCSPSDAGIGVRAVEVGEHAFPARAPRRAARRRVASADASFQRTPARAIPVSISRWNGRSLAATPGLERRRVADRGPQVVRRGARRSHSGAAGSATRMGRRSRGAERRALLDRRHAEAPRVERLQRARDRDGAETVAVSFDHRQQPAAGERRPACARWRPARRGRRPPRRAPCRG